MAWWKFWDKGTVTKSSSTDLPAHVIYLLDTFGSGIGDLNLTPITAYRFYFRIAPLQSSVGKVAGAISRLPLVLRDEEKPDSITKESDILTLLENPSPLTTKQEFFKNLAVSYLICRELWVIARGRVERPPVELVFVHPYNVTIVEDAVESWPKEIQITTRGTIQKFFREDVRGRFRYFDRSRMNEIFPYIVENSEIGDSGRFRGVSQLSSIKDELMSYKTSVLSNSKSIENTGRPSGLISPEDDTLDEEEMDKLETSIKNLQGPLNSGQIGLIPAKVKAVFERWAPKDMDYDKLQINVKKTIWNLYSIPLPIVSDEGQTFANFQESQTAFYDEAVNEAWGPIADGLEWMLQTRFDFNRQKLDYNPFEVPALRRRAVKQTESMTKSQVFSVDEIRESAGYEKSPGGENVLVDARKTTLSSVVQAADFDTDPNG